MRDVLSIQGLHAWYGESHVLHGVDLNLREGEVVSLLGRNGSGRTTTLRAVLGLTGARTGSVRVNGTESIGLPTHRVASLGIGYCPEDRGIFGSLTVAENFLLPPRLGACGMAVADIEAMFPSLRAFAARPGMHLSGGEQQMLAIARILRTGARLLLLDEISEGLAPIIVDRLADAMRELKSRGYTILLVEQSFHFAASIADRFYVMEHGRIVSEFQQRELDSNLPALVAQLGI